MCEAGCLAVLDPRDVRCQRHLQLMQVGIWKLFLKGVYP